MAELSPPITVSTDSRQIAAMFKKAGAPVLAEWNFTQATYREKGERAFNGAMKTTREVSVRGTPPGSRDAREFIFTLEARPASSVREPGQPVKQLEPIKQLEFNFRWQPGFDGARDNSLKTEQTGQKPWRFYGGSSANELIERMLVPGNLDQASREKAARKLLGEEDKNLGALTNQMSTQAEAFVDEVTKLAHPATAPVAQQKQPLRSPLTSSRRAPPI